MALCSLSQEWTKDREIIIERNRYTKGYLTTIVFSLHDKRRQSKRGIVYVNQELRDALASRPLRDGTRRQCRVKYAARINRSTGEAYIAIVEIAIGTIVFNERSLHDA